MKSRSSFTTPEKYPLKIFFKKNIFYRVLLTVECHNQPAFEVTGAVVKVVVVDIIDVVVVARAVEVVTSADVVVSEQSKL